MTCLRLLALGALLGQGCIALPYATPPLKVRVGGGRFLEFADETPEMSGLVFDLTAAAHPQQLLVEPLRRNFDFGVGYRLQIVEHGRRRHGAFLEGAYLIPLTDDRRARAVVRVTGDFMMRGDQPGGGGSLAAGIEWAADTAQPLLDADDDTMVLGYALGEAALGFEVGASSYVFAQGPEVLITASVVIRLPASLGVFLVWLGDATKD